MKFTFKKLTIRFFSPSETRLHGLRRFRVDPDVFDVTINTNELLVVLLHYFMEFISQNCI